MSAKSWINNWVQFRRLRLVVVILIGLFIFSGAVSLWPSPAQAVSIYTPTPPAQINTLCICEHSQGCDALTSTTSQTDWYNSSKCTEYCREKYKTDLKVDPPKFFTSAENNEAVNAKRACDDKKTLAQETGSTAAGVAVAIGETTAPRPFVSPNLTTQIPGLVFTEPTGEDEITVNFIGEYINALYKWIMGVAISLAIVMIMIGGLQYVIGSATGGGKQKGMERMKNAAVGFVLLMSVYLILYTVNPQLTVFRPLQLEQIDQKLFEQFPPRDLAGFNESNPSASGGEYEQMAYRVAESFGMNGCLFAVQKGMESGWNPKAATSCCFGLGQILWTNARSYLSKERETIVEKHSAGCPLCPPQGTEDKETISKWLLDDPEGNLILAAMLKRDVVKSTPNPVAQVGVYGFGIGTHRAYKKATGCSVVKKSDADFLNALKSGTSTETLLREACIPPDIWPQKTSCPQTHMCCVSSTGSCERPGFSPKGRIGVCHEPDSGSCAAVAGGASYVNGYISRAKRQCL